jgi:DNA-binding NtrC family response regulator
MVIPRMDGLALLRALPLVGADVTTLLLTAQGTVDTAVEAMKEGAYDYLTKPVDIQRLKILLDKIVERLETMREVKALRRQLREHGTFGSLIGNSPEMRKIYQVVEQAAPTAASVLITGESGTGKELIAQTIHQLSARAGFPFIAINCAAIPETLLESEIFGHEKGAFTGAMERRVGCFELAEGGTLLLDEIAEMPVELQPKLLRVLQERSYRKIGSEKTYSVDFRLICSTNRLPADAIREGLLRDDLFYRISTITIHVPPLRERSEDTQLLTEHFLKMYAQKYDRAITGVSQAAYQKLFAHGWPGNVRELQNVIERAVLLAKDFYDDDAPAVLTKLLAGPADVVLSDMAASATGDTQTDHLRIMGLAEAAHDFARQVLKPGGTFVAKVLRGGTERTLLDRLKHDFTKVRHTKPEASRADSAEMYVVGTGFRG